MPPHGVVPPNGDTLYARSNFTHMNAAHCESGVTASLLNHSGLTISEPMAFGIGSGLFFAHMPFVKVMDLPLTSYRSWPGSIAKKAFSRLGVSLRTEKFSTEHAGIKRLDELLAQGIAVGAQSSVLWLSYLPKQFRFPFNAHHLIVLERRGDSYLISDPIGEHLVECPADLFTKCRFAKGALAPKGKIFYCDERVKQADIRRAAISGLNETCQRMLYTPFPFAGLFAMKYLANQIRRWPQSIKDEQRRQLHLAQIVRMQEEVGTGGAGFRFLFAAFLQECGAFSGFDNVAKLSEEFTKSGDQFRQFAVESARVCRNRSTIGYDGIANLFLQCRSLESHAFKSIWKALPKR
jgi:hypothetical protein